MVVQITPSASRHISLPFHEDARIALEGNRMICLSGEAGSGKSYAARHLARELSGQEPIPIYCSPVSDISEFFGAFRLIANETRFQEGLLSRAILGDPGRGKSRYFVCEEFSLLSVEVRTAVFMGLRTERQVVNPMCGATLEVRDDFRIIFTSLRENLACRRSAESMRALMSGVVVIDVPPLATADMEAILQKEFPDAPLGLVMQAVELYGQYKTVGNDREEEGHSVGLNIRHAEHLVRLLLAGMPVERAVRIALCNAHILDDARYQAALLKHSISALSYQKVETDQPAAVATASEVGSQAATESF